MTTSPRFFATSSAALSLLSLVLASCGGGGGNGGAVVQPRASATASQLSANPTTALTADGQTTSTLTVLVRDDGGRPLAGRRVRLTATGTGNVLAPSDGTTDGAGRMTATLASTVAEPKRVQATVDPGTQTSVVLAQAADITFVAPDTPVLVAPARFEDRDDDGRASRGDAVVLRFSTAVQVTASRPEDFRLAVTDDNLGTGVQVQAGSAPEEVAILLGDGARLRARGTFDGASTTANSPSAIDVASGALGIVSAATGQPAVPSTARDVVPGLVDRTTVAASDASAVAAGDLDADGDIDLFVAETGADRVLLRDASGNLVDSQRLGNQPTRGLAVGDLDRFGGDDVVTAHDGFAQLWINRSNSSGLDFIDGGTLVAGQAKAVAMLDVDGDGFRDVVVGSDDAVRVFRNGRNLGVTLTLVQTVATAGVRRLAAADVDGDGDLDLLAGTTGGAVLLRVDGGALAAPAMVDATAATSLAVGDVDGDGDLDVVTGDGVGARLLRNDGRGSFAAEAVAASALEVALGDLDGDARADLLTRDAAGIAVRFRVGDAFADAAQTIADTAARSLLVADVDRDGDLDLTAARGADVAVRHGSLRGAFGLTGLAVGDAQPPAPSTALAAADLDGDGDDDLIVGREGDDVILLNDGRGGFTFSGQASHRLGDGLTSAVATGDLDGDGDVDVVTVERFDQNRTPRWRAWFNDGTGAFSPLSVELPHQATEDARALAIGDIDGNGSPDVLVGCNGENKAFRLVNFNGQPTFFGFANVFNPQVNDRDTRALVLFDLDGEGDLDLVVGNFGGGQANQVFRLSLVNGNPSYNEFPLLGNEPTVAAAVADFDGDGLIDIVFANADNGQNFQHRVHSLARRGVSAVGQPIRFSSGSAATAMATADVDGDGRLDLLMGTADGNLQVWRQSAPLGFTIAQQLPLAGITGLVAGDFDRDGDADAFATTAAADVGIVNR